MAGVLHILMPKCLHSLPHIHSKYDKYCDLERNRYHDFDGFTQVQNIYSSPACGKGVYNAVCVWLSI